MEIPRINGDTWEWRDHDPPERKIKTRHQNNWETNEETTIDKNWGWKLKAENEESSKMMAFGGTGMKTTQKCTR